MRRRSFLLIPLALAPPGYAGLLEPQWLELTHDVVPAHGIAPGESIRLVHLSDLHASQVVPNSLIERAVSMALEQKPDFVCLTGDYITEGNGYDREWYVRTLRRLSTQVPTFGTLGNHDGGAWSGKPGTRPYTTDAVVKMLEDSGVRVLTNKHESITVRSQPVRVVGMGDLWAKQCNPWVAFRGVPQDTTPTIILSHNPDSKVMMEEFRFDLMLSGHTHGGQVVMPFTGESPAPVADKRYVKGLKPWNGRMINVTAGVGNVGGVRFNCRPQVNVLELRTA